MMSNQQVIHNIILPDTLGHCHTGEVVTTLAVASLCEISFYGSTASININSSLQDHMFSSLFTPDQ